MSLYISMPPMLPMLSSPRAFLEILDQRPGQRGVPKQYLPPTRPLDSLDMYRSYFEPHSQPAQSPIEKAPLTRSLQSYSPRVSTSRKHTNPKHVMSRQARLRTLAEYSYPGQPRAYVVALIEVAIQANIGFNKLRSYLNKPSPRFTTLLRLDAMKFIEANTPKGSVRENALSSYNAILNTMIERFPRTPSLFTSPNSRATRIQWSSVTRQPTINPTDPLRKSAMVIGAEILLGIDP